MNSKKLWAALAVVGLILVAFLFWSERGPSPSSTTPVAAGGEISAVPAVPAVEARARAGVGVAAVSQPSFVARVMARPEPGREEAFVAFEDWRGRHARAAAADRAGLEAEGVVLARARLTALADLMQSNPERALALAVPGFEREQLPAAVRAQMEQPVNTVGAFSVIGTLPFGKPGEVPAVFRTATIDGETHHAFTYGRGLEFLTRQQAPLNGFSVPTTAATKPPVNPLVRAAKLLVMDPEIVRVLPPAELEALKKNEAGAVAGAKVVMNPQAGAEAADCNTTGQPLATSNPTAAAQVAGQYYGFCCSPDMQKWAAGTVAAAGLTIPGGAKSMPTAESSYTEGRKRMLLMLPYWTNQSVAMSTNFALTHYNNFSNYMWQMSYGKLRLAAIGQGSDITPPMLLPGSVTDYVAGLGGGANDAWVAVRDVASTNYGYDLGQYDFLYYATTDRPSASYCGLGFVGGVGFHLANSCFDAQVTSHEFGHNLGLNHANFWNTSLASIIGAGVNDEYGDNNDPMGGGGNPNQFNSRYKNYLGWVTNSDIATIPATGSNRYRLYAFDLDFGTGLRGLKFARSGSQNYWLQFRQRKTTSDALMNGAQLMWTGNGNQSSYVLDVRLRGGAGDNAIVIGRTFSEPGLNFHVTPIGKGKTYPESLDVVAVTGPQPGNLPPYATLAASTLTPSTGQTVTFTATASDPNGDALAYYWEFGDGADSYSDDNLPVQTKSYSSAGEYAVRCVVSDLRGGVTQHTLIVRVGNPSVFRISGHVVDQYSKPVVGARVTAGSRTVYVDADGSYIIPGLAAGNYTVSAMEPVSGATTFVTPFFANPVAVGPSVTNADFIVGTNPPAVTLLAAGSNWRYLDDGSDQGTAWQAPVFNDSGWSNGPAQLGYGNDGEVTTISYGPDANNKHITYYFRTAFNVANPAAITNLQLNVLRDDGVIVYLNGTEIFRDNLPGGAVTYTTTAPGTAPDDGDTWLTTSVPMALLLTGANTLAVEVHQESVTSSDVTFDLSMTAEAAGSAQSAAIVYVASPADNATFNSPTNLTIAAHAVGTPSAVTSVEVYDGATLLGTDATAPYTAILNSPANGLHALRAVSISAAGVRRTSAPVNITVSAPASGPVALSLVPTGSVWRYFCTNVGASVGWTNQGYNDATWSNGAARLGFGAVSPATTIYGGPSGARYPAAYFRHAFVVNDPAAITSLTLQLARDDGAVVYLNGNEVLRDNITNGVTPTYSMLASNAADNGGTYFAFALPPGALTLGTNIVAAEVHQSSATSSDMLFDLGLSAVVASNRSRGCWLVSPAPGSTTTQPNSVTLMAEVVAGGTLGVTQMQFFANGALVGQDVTYPFSFNWGTPTTGAQSLVAVATDSTGGAITSAPVAITVAGAPAGEALISFGESWKYLDDGSDQGTAWKNSAFNDNAWMAGPARLGYGGDGEVTTVSYGTNANFKHITTYFRKKFVAGNPAALSGLLLRLALDDGAVVYLNGVEVLRTNLLAGAPVSYNSLALTAVGGAAETTPIDVVLSTAGLVAGTNTLAVEVHQEAITSSDLGLDVALTGLRSTNTADGIYLTSPANGARFNVPATVPLSAYAVSSSGAITLVEYFAGTNKVGQSAATPYPANWAGAAAGIHMLTAVATLGGGQRMTSPPINIVVGPTPPPILPVFTTFFGYGSAWKYWDSATAVSNGWAGLAFDDGAWPAGNARFGWGLDGESTLLTEGRVTHYFRKSIVVTNGGALDSFTFNLMRDDGAVVYFNGVEVFRNNMPAGAVDGGTLASSTINTPDETLPVTVTIPTAGLGLRHGTNIVAVELHQSSGASSDASFDFMLYAEGTTEGRIYIATPTNNAALVAGSPVALEAQAQVPAGRVLTAVEFFSNGTNVGTVSAPPYRVNWSSGAIGVNILTARVLDNAGGSITSAPVQVVLGLPTVSLVLVPSNSVWRFLDNGSNQGTNWSQTNFNDSAWSFGPARLGYGGDGEETTVSAGALALKYTNTYFRRAFVVPPDTFITNLTFRLVRDDGAVVWLNGREMYRSNMPAGTITSMTLATASVGNADEQTFFVTTLGITNLFPGTNFLGVEIHQNAGNSSDLGFDLQLEGFGYVLATAPPELAATADGGLLRLAWPASATGFQLYWRPQLDAGVWQAVPGVPVVSNGWNLFPVPMTNGTGFYRLQK